MLKVSTLSDLIGGGIRLALAGLNTLVGNAPMAAGPVGLAVRGWLTERLKHVSE